MGLEDHEKREVPHRVRNCPDRPDRPDRGSAAGEQNMNSAAGPSTPQKTCRVGKKGDPKTLGKRGRPRKAPKPEAPKELTVVVPVDDAGKTVPRTALVRRDPLDGGYDKVFVLPAGVALVRKLAAESYPLRSIARVLGIGLGTFQRLMDRQEEVRAALEEGRAEEERALVADLRTASTKGNIVAAIFLLKARHGYREGDALDQRPNVIINLPDAATPEAYLRMVEGGPALPPTGAAGAGSSP